MDRFTSLFDVRALLDRIRRERVAYHPSPADWREEVLYFLLPDRFSDGRESQRRLLTRQVIAGFRQNSDRGNWNWASWASSGRRWQGGTIAGIRGRLAYLEALGVTTLWVGPVFKQRVKSDSYHGYGIQDFLEVDARFGTRRDLVDLVAAAHEKKMRVILDIIIQHTGDNWGYVPPGQPPAAAFDEPYYRPWPTYYGDPDNPELRGWKTAWRNALEQGFSFGQGVQSGVTAEHDGVWPKDLQDWALYSRAGKGELGDSGDPNSANYIGNPHAEHKRSDFFSLKDVTLDNPAALNFIADCFKYWIAVTDCDGFRIDTVKHVAPEEARNFCGRVREFADTLGKRNFFLVAEVAGGDWQQAFYIAQLAVLQRNLTAALDIGEARETLTAVAKGLVPGKDYLEDFLETAKAGADPFGTHRNFGNRHVSIVDDHDHVRGEKLRFSARIPDNSPVKDYQIAAATAIQLFTLGIPCLYYGSEQAFAGPAQSQWPYLYGHGWGGGDYADRYLREAMFGPDHPRADHGTNSLTDQVNNVDASLPGFGPFGTSGFHGFDSKSPSFVRIAAMLRVRGQYPVLRIGRQYARELRLPHTGFELPGSGELVAWSRILDTQEAVVIVNGNGDARRGGDVVVARELWGEDVPFEVALNTAQAAADARGETYAGTHAHGSDVRTRRDPSTGTIFLEVRDVGPAETLVLVKQF